MQRIRTTKERAKRIDLLYFSQRHWLRDWRFWLSVALPVLALGWLLTSRAQGGQKPFSSGPLSRAHAVFTQKCALCHTQQAGSFFEEATDKSCLNCHDAPAHHANQKFTPTCGSCHVEHKGSTLLRATADTTCTQCHSDLQGTGGPVKFEHAIESFDDKHPEFAAVRDKKDAGGVKLNHYVHLQPNLIGPNNTRVQMACDDCHRTAGVAEEWPYAGPQGLKPASLATASGTAEAVPFANPANTQDVPHSMRGISYMAAPKFSEHCAGCHLLEFDTRFPGEQVPHDKTDLIHKFLTERFTQYIAAHPGSIREVLQPDRRIPGRFCTPRVASSAAQWVQFRLEEAEWVLWIKTCKECHTLMEGGALLQDKGCVTPNAAASPLPEIVKSNITARWLPHAEFDHHSHRMMKCAACHTAAPDSHNTADVLIPSIKTCQQCHRSAGPAKDFADGRCSECHRYHNWKNEKRVKGVYEMHELRSASNN